MNIVIVFNCLTFLLYKDSHNNVKSTQKQVCCLSLLFRVPLVSPAEYFYASNSFHTHDSCLVFKAMIYIFSKKISEFLFLYCYSYKKNLTFSCQILLSLCIRLKEINGIC